MHPLTKPCEDIIFCMQLFRALGEVLVTNSLFKQAKVIQGFPLCFLGVGIFLLQLLYQQLEQNIIFSVRWC